MESLTLELPFSEDEDELVASNQRRMYEGGRVVYSLLQLSERCPCQI